MLTNGLLLLIIAEVLAADASADLLLCLRPLADHRWDRGTGIDTAARANESLLSGPGRRRRLLGVVAGNDLDMFDAMLIVETTTARFLGKLVTAAAYEGIP